MTISVFLKLMNNYYEMDTPSGDDEIQRKQKKYSSVQLSAWPQRPVDLKWARQCARVRSQIGANIRRNMQNFSSFFCLNYLSQLIDVSNYKFNESNQTP